MNKITQVTALDIQKLVEIALHSNITYLALFGSFARDDATFESDVDLAVRFGRPITLFDLAGVQLEMEQALGRKVDLIPIDSAYSFIRDSITRDAIVLYESEQKDMTSPVSEVIGRNNW